MPIHFRELNTGVPDTPALVTDYWQVEYWNDEVSYPAGIAWVAVWKKKPPDSEWCEAILEYLFVIGSFRRRGIGTELLDAICERWPTVLIGPGSDDGEAFLGKRGVASLSAADADHRTSKPMAMPLFDTVTPANHPNAHKVLDPSGELSTVWSSVPYIPDKKIKTVPLPLWVFLVGNRCLRRGGLFRGSLQ